MTWDPSGKNAAVVLSNGNLTADCIGTQTCVRTILGRDPADGGPDRQAEIVVPGSIANSDRPILGMCDEDYDIVNATALGLANAHAWGFFTGVQFIASNGRFHNGVPGGNWDPGGGGTGGLATSYQLCYSPTAKTFTLYRQGIIQLFPFSSVGTNGKLMYMAFGSGSAPAVDEYGTINEDGGFNFDIPGHVPWSYEQPAGSSGFFALL